MQRHAFSFALIAITIGSAVLAQPSVVRTADPIKRGLKLSDFPRTIKVTDNVYTYEDFHAGPEKFTTTNMFVVTDEGVLVADGQGSPAETKGLVDAIAKVTRQPIKYVVICSDHGDHTAGNASFPAGVPVDQAIKQANWGAYASWTLASSQGPIAIRKVYEELSGQLK